MSVGHRHHQGRVTMLHIDTVAHIRKGRSEARPAGSSESRTKQPADRIGIHYQRPYFHASARNVPGGVESHLDFAGQWSWQPVAGLAAGARSGAGLRLDWFVHPRRRVLFAYENAEHAGFSYA